jgi:hypothetical protein
MSLLTRLQAVDDRFPRLTRGITDPVFDLRYAARFAVGLLTVGWLVAFALVFWITPDRPIYGFIALSSAAAGSSGMLRGALKSHRHDANTPVMAAGLDGE